MSDDIPQNDPGQYVVVARRYRPQNFSELVGQNQVSQALANAIATNRVGHAYLFTGARGVGKTSTARIFAKALDCVKGPTATPCGECDICQGIASGEDVDVIEIDGASNRGIDEIRQLRQNANVRPSRARYKIYIIDEVHMLTTPAFNALLKTLEEPPEHVKFIFCTTEADKIPITVLSRCQRFDFAPIETKSILERLQSIAKNEGVEAETEALQILARRAAGSMRDSQSLLEQLLSFGGKKIAVADVHAMLGTAKSSRLAAVVQAVIARDAAAALREVSGAVSEGVDVGQFAEQLVGYFRDVLAVHVGCDAEMLLHTSAADLPQLQNSGKQLGIETLLAIVQILDQALGRMRHSTHVRTLVEIALVRICKLEDLDQLPALVAQVRDGIRVQGPGSRSQEPGARSQGTGDSGQETGNRRQEPAAQSILTDPQKKTLAVGANHGAEIVAPVENAPVLTAESLPMIWKEALASIEDLTADFARKADTLAIAGPNHVVASFRGAYNKEQCQRPERKARLEQALSKVVGTPVRIDFELLPEAPSGESGVARPVVSAAQNRIQRRKEAEKSPLIRQAIEMFDGEITSVVAPAATEEEDSA